MTFYIVLTVHLLLCFVLVGLVLLQQGKGADLGATLGGGSNTVFGAGGATSLVVRTTTLVAVAFMATSIILVRLYKAEAMSRAGKIDVLEGSLLRDQPIAQPATAPVEAVATTIPQPVVTSGPQAVVTPGMAVAPSAGSAAPEVGATAVESGEAAVSVPSVPVAAAASPEVQSPSGTLPSSPEVQASGAMAPSSDAVTK